jgi:hypothetical protein
LHPLIPWPLKALEFAGVLTWQHRITRLRERCRDLFGREGWCWRVVRTSNAYVFRDPKPLTERSSDRPEPGWRCRAVQAIA